MMSATDHTFWKGAIGTLSPVLGVMLSSLSDIEQHLRVLSLCGGLVVCALTIRSFIKNWDK